MYGAERWIVALCRNLSIERVDSRIVIPLENDAQYDVVREFEAAGLSIDVVPGDKSVFQILRNIRRFLQENEVDVVHTHGYKSDILGLLAARSLGITAITTPHGFGTPASNRLGAYIWLGKRFLRYFDRVAPLSRQLEEEVIESGVTAGRVEFIRNATDLSEIEPHVHYVERRFSEEPQKRVIGYVGQLIPRKRIEHLIEVFDDLWSLDRSIELRIVGDGESRLKAESLANELPSRNAIRFLGFRSDRLELMRDFDVFVMTSSDEGIPRCMMEAMALGVPVAAYDIPGVDRLVQHGRTGMLAESGAKEELANHVRWSLVNRTESEEQARRGREFISRKFSGQRMADEYMALYESLLKE